MHRIPIPFGLMLVVAWLMSLTLTGCIMFPQQEFNSYREAFADFKGATEKILAEYDLAKKAEDTLKNRKPVQNKLPYPMSVEISPNVSGAALADPVSVRRQALQVVSNFNNVLAVLAEGRNVGEVKSSIDSLIGGINKLPSLFESVTDGAAIIPYVGQITPLVSTVVAKLEESHNREQFILAMREAEPMVHGIFQLFAKDAENIYEIRARQADRKWTRHQDTVATLVRQMRSVSKEYRAGQGHLAEELKQIEDDIREVLDHTGLPYNDHKLLPAQSSDKPFSRLVLSQLEQTFVQVTEAARKYEAVIKEQIALHKLILSYGALLAKTDASLTVVRTALDSPPEIRAQARDLIALAFQLKRDWEALEEARRVAAGS